MPSGRGLMRGVPQFAPWADVFALPDFTSWALQADIAQDWYFAGRGPQVPTEIPWRWIGGPLTRRQDPPQNAAAVTTADGGEAFATNQTSVDEYGQWPFQASLATATTYDPQNLADWVTAYHTDPRTRLPAIVLPFLKRTDEEVRLILGREVGHRITITGTPSMWPADATELVIEGIVHQSSADERSVTWCTTPVIGAAVGQTGPWFRVGVSRMGGSDVLPF